MRMGWGPRVSASDRVDFATELLLDGPYPVGSRLPTLHRVGGLRCWCGNSGVKSRAAASLTVTMIGLYGLVVLAVMVRRRSERLPGPCSWVDTIAEVVGHCSASHAPW